MAGFGVLDNCVIPVISLICIIIQHTFDARVIPSIKAATKYIPPTTSTLVRVGPSLGLKD